MLAEVIISVKSLGYPGNNLKVFILKDDTFTESGPKALEGYFGSNGGRIAFFLVSQEVPEAKAIIEVFSIAPKDSKDSKDSSPPPYIEAQRVRALQLIILLNAKKIAVPRNARVECYCYLEPYDKSVKEVDVVERFIKKPPGDSIHKANVYFQLHKNMNVEVEYEAKKKEEEERKKRKMEEEKEKKEEEEEKKKREEKEEKEEEKEKEEEEEKEKEKEKEEEKEEEEELPSSSTMRVVEFKFSDGKKDDDIIMGKTIEFDYKLPVPATEQQPEKTKKDNSKITVIYENVGNFSTFKSYLNSPPSFSTFKKIKDEKASKKEKQ